MKRIAVFLLVIVVSLLLGIGYGSCRTERATGHVIEKILVNSSSGNLLVHVEALERLRSGNQDNAAELLERLVDLDLAQLAAHSKFIMDQRQEDVESAIQKAKAYRVRYPGHKVNEKLAGSVVKGFELAK